MLRITDVRVRKIEDEGRLKAIAAITIDGVFVVHELKVVEGPYGNFVAMPSRMAANGEYKDIAHPIKTKTRKMIQEKVLEAYESLTD